MTTPNRLLAAVLLLAPVAVGCGRKQEPPAPAPSTTLAASPATAPTGAASPMPETQPTRTPVGSAMPAAGARAATPAGPPAEGATTTTVPATTPAARPTPTPPAAASPSPLPAEAMSPPPAPAPKVPTLPRPQGKITLPAKLGAVTFDHQKHSDAMDIACTRCHHPSRPQKPLAAEQQACRDCHTSPPTPPLKTALQAAFHDPKATAGTCIDCHREAVAQGKQPPVKCTECHKAGRT